MVAHEGEWFQVSGGLRLVAHAIVLQLIMVFVAFLTILFLASSRGDGLEMVAMLLAVAAVVVGFLAMILLLAAAKSLALHLESLAVERKARIAIGMVVLATAVFAFVKLAVTPDDPGSLAATLVVVTIVEVVAFVNVLGTVRGLDVALRSPAPFGLRGAGF